MRFIKTLAASALTVLLSANPVFAAIEAGGFHVDGWTIEHGDNPLVCSAAEPPNGQTRLTLAAEGPLFLLLVEAGDFPKAKASYQVALSFDGKPPVQGIAVGEGGLLSISAGRGGPAQTIAASSRVAITVNGSTHEFSLKNAAAALDAVARCAGQQTLAEQDNRPPAPVPGAAGWTIAETLPGYTQRACSARRAGAQVDVILLLNDASELVLIGGHSDWATWPVDLPLQLAIDGGPPVTLKANGLNNLLLTLVKDPDLVGRLRAAKTLDLTIPTGHVRADVTGFGLALDAVKKCKGA